MLDDLFYADNLKAAGDAALRPPPVPKQAAGFSAWKTTTAAPRGVVAGGAQSGGFFADTLAAFGQALGGTGTASAQGMFSTQTDAERQQSEQQAQKIRAEGLDFSSSTGDNLRGFARFLAPDPETAHTAERLVFDLSRVMTKAVGYSVAGGGPLAGAVLTGADEGMTTADDLKQAGVDLGTRTAVGGVVGLSTAVGVALPVAGNTLAQTAGLVATGGPLSFMAQQQAVRTILQAADYSKLAEQYDPFDPVGLAVSTLIPAGFGAWGLRAAKVRAAGERAQADFMAGPVPSAETAIAQAARVASQEHVDAAHVVFGMSERARFDDGALTRAGDQLATGSRVSVADMVPAVRAVESLESFAARTKLKDERLPAEVRGNFLGWLRDQGGIDSAAQLDLTGEQGIRSNPAGVFRRTGVGLDELARAAERDGYLPPGAVASDLDNGGTRAFGELVQRAVSGERVLTMQERIAAAERMSAEQNRAARLEAVQRKLELLGVDAGKFGDRLDLLEAYAAAHEPHLLAAAMDEISAAARAAEPRAEADYLDATARQIAQDVQDVGRTLAEHEAVVGKLSPILRGKVSRLLEPTNAKEPAAAKPPAPEPASAAPATPARAAPAAAGAEGARSTTAAAKAGLVEDSAAAARVEQVKTEAPDLMVQLDGMDAPMRIDDLLAAIKSEADDMVLDGELMQLAAECALRVGA